VTTIELALVTSIVPGLAGVVIAYAVLTMKGNALRRIVSTASGVFANFGGVPLAFLFIATLGTTGIVTSWLNTLGIDPYQHGFTLFSFIGVSLVYAYFQIPLMILVITPAIDGLKREWREAAEILGASNSQYWRYVALPVLWPSILGASLLLFANAFGAVATAYALTGSVFNIVPIQLYAQIRGDVLHNPNLGYALAVGMLVITGVSNLAYLGLRARSERWMK
jgi:putative spermidine/putrescine transport system permease protein